jgi:hypothetical protein
MKDQWIRDMRRLLDDYEKDPPHDLLYDVKQVMGERNLMPESKPKRKARMVYLWIARSVAAAAVVLIMGLLFHNIHVTHEGTEQQMAQKSESSRLQEKSIYSALQRVFQESKPDIDHSMVGKVAASARAKFKTYSSRSGNVDVFPTTSSSSGLLAKMSESGQGKIVSSSDSSANVSSGTSDSRENPLYSQISSSSGQNSQGLDHSQKNKKKENAFHEYSKVSPVPVRHHRNRHISFGPFCSGAMGEDAGPAGQGLVLADAAPYGPLDGEKYALANSLVYGIDKLQTKTHYDQPVKFGLSVAYPVANELSLHAGFVYSLLSSDETRSNSTEEYKTHQKLHYVGVQLSASHSLWRKDHFNVYVTAGGGVDKMVSGKAKTKYYVNDGLISTTKDDVKMHQLQWSVNGTAGVEYNLVPHINLYVEPGVAYYFRNGSPVQTIYKDKPFIFHLSVGLRFNIRDVGK